MRGIMSFDDYNYKQYNQYVLIEEPCESARRRQIEMERKEFKKLGDNPQRSLVPKNLSKIPDDFIHDEMNLSPDRRHSFAKTLSFISKPDTDQGGVFDGANSE